LRGVVEKHRGYTRAFYILGQSLGKQGNLADAHYYLGIYHARKRELKTAIFQYRQALKYTQDAERQATIEKRLKRLEKILAEQRKS
jgi:hypothetical protein